MDSIGLLALLSSGGHTPSKVASFASEDGNTIVTVDTFAYGIMCITAAMNNNGKTPCVLIQNPSFIIGPNLQSFSVYVTGNTGSGLDYEALCTITSSATTITINTGANRICRGTIAVFK